MTLFTLFRNRVSRKKVSTFGQYLKRKLQQCLETTFFYAIRGDFKTFFLPYSNLKIALKSPNKLEIGQH